MVAQVKTIALTLFTLDNSVKPTHNCYNTGYCRARAPQTGRNAWRLASWSGSACRSS